MDSDNDDVMDLTDGATGVITAAAESDVAAEKKVRTATGDAEYNADWNGIESSNDPTLATPRLLHSARQWSALRDGGRYAGRTVQHRCLAPLAA